MRVYRENSYCGKPSAINPSQFYQKFCNMPRPKMGNRSWQFRLRGSAGPSRCLWTSIVKGIAHGFQLGLGLRSHRVSPGETVCWTARLPRQLWRLHTWPSRSVKKGRWLWDCDFIRSSPLISVAKRLKISCKSTYGTLHSRPTFLGEFYEESWMQFKAAETEFPAEGWCQKHWTIHLTYKSAFGKRYEKVLFAWALCNLR